MCSFPAIENWSAVVTNHIPLYVKARKLKPDSALAKEADKIAAQTTDPQKRMMAALRLGQDRVRYVAMVLGEGAYRPIAADETWDARYGDCKAKSALMLALLDRLGIKAEAMYVNASTGDAIGERLPSLDVFDHVIVKATIDGKAYYLDATDFGHRIPKDVVGTSYAFGLPIASGSTLEKLPGLIATEPTQDTELEWDGSKGLTGEVAFKARLTLRGALAIRARLKKTSAEKVSDFEDFLKSYMPGIENDKLTIVSQQDNAETGEYVVQFAGKDEMGWDEYEDRKGARFPFSNTTSKWEVDFDRKEGPFMDTPVALNPAYWRPGDRNGHSSDDQGLQGRRCPTHRPDACRDPYLAQRFDQRQSGCRRDELPPSRPEHHRQASPRGRGSDQVDQGKLGLSGRTAQFEAEG